LSARNDFTLVLLQIAAAAARIAGNGDIYHAVQSLNLELVADHLTVDPTLARSWRNNR
jgi:hypothetical protein